MDGTVATLATIAAYTSSYSTTVSETSLLLMWGAALLATARLVRRRQVVPALAPRQAVDPRPTSNIGLEAGAQSLPAAR